MSKTSSAFASPVSGSAKGLSIARIILANIIVRMITVSNLGWKTILATHLLNLLNGSNSHNDFPSMLST